MDSPENAQETLVNQQNRMNRTVVIVALLVGLCPVIWHVMQGPLDVPSNSGQVIQAGLDRDEDVSLPEIVRDPVILEGGAIAENIVSNVLVESLYLRGRVVNEQGEPVQGARFVIGSHTEFPGGLSRRPLDGGVQSSAESDANGRFVIVIADNGVRRVEVVASGYSTLLRKVNIDRYGKDEVFLLRRVAGLMGRVVNGDGRPVSGAIVAMASREPSDLELMSSPEGSKANWPVVRSDDNGEFKFASLDAGAAYAVAGVWVAGLRVPLALAQASFHLGAGEIRRWDCVLRQSARLRVAFVDEGGGPVAVSRVYAICGGQPGGAYSGPRLFNLVPAGELEEKRGTIWEAVHAGDEPHAIVAEVRSGPERVEHVRHDGIVPSGEVTIIKLPSQVATHADQAETGVVIGRIVHPIEGLVGRVLRVELRRTGGGIKSEGEGPEFRFSRVPAGMWRLRILADTVPVLVGEWFEVYGNRTNDVGAIAIGKLGSLEVGIVDRGGAGALALEQGSVYNEMYAYPLVPNGVMGFKANCVVPGRYCIIVRGMASVAFGTIDVTPGAIAKVWLENTAASRKTMEVWLPAPKAWAKCKLQIANQSGHVLSSIEVQAERQGARPVQWADIMPLGSLKLSVTIDGVERLVKLLNNDVAESHVRYVCSVQ